MSIYSSLHPVSFMLLRLSTNSFVVKSQLARVQQSRMCVGNSESVQVHSFCRDYNLEIVTELLQLVNLAIKKIVLFCLSRVRSALFFLWNSALSIMGNGAGNCWFIFAQCFVNVKYFWKLLSTIARGLLRQRNRNICSPQPAHNLAFKELLLPLSQDNWMPLLPVLIEGTGSRTQCIESSECVWQSCCTLMHCGNSVFMELFLVCLVHFLFFTVFSLTYSFPFLTCTISRDLIDKKTTKIRIFSI